MLFFLNSLTFCCFLPFGLPLWVINIDVLQRALLHNWIFFKVHFFAAVIAVFSVGFHLVELPNLLQKMLKRIPSSQRRFALLSQSGSPHYFLWQFSFRSDNDLFGDLHEHIIDILIASDIRLCQR